MTIQELEQQLDKLDTYFMVSVIGGFILMILVAVVAMKYMSKWLEYKMVGYCGACVLILAITFGVITAIFHFGNEEKELYAKYLDTLPTETYELTDVALVGGNEGDFQFKGKSAYKTDVKFTYEKDGKNHSYKGLANVDSLNVTTVSFKDLKEPVGNYEAGLYEVTIK